MKKTCVFLWCLGACLCSQTFQSCSREDTGTAEVIKPVLTSSSLTKNSSYSQIKEITYTITEIKLNDISLEESCEATEFVRVISKHLEDLLNDPYFDFDLINYYTELNRKYVTYYRGENYYGPNGEYNQLARKRIRELTSFWNLDREIYLNGQHTSFLNDLEILTDMIESFDRTVRNRTEAYEKAKDLMNINLASLNIPENPYFALDAFTRSTGLLVIGDGLLESLVETGIDGDIAFSAILSHEWWHQAQFENEEKWSYIDNLPGKPEKTRFSELEADFAAAYFMAHKRGATYNWKRIEEYFRLSFNVGDCLINSDQHHGTPAQRLAAAQLGFKLAEAAQKKGFILSPDEVHQAFLDSFETMVL